MLKLIVFAALFGGAVDLGSAVALLWAVTSPVR